MNTRALAAQILRRVTEEGASLTAALEAELPKIPAANDRAFVQALCFGVVRWYHRLDFILRQLATKPIRDEQIRLLALIGLYQLEYTRVKPHAAVAETVSAADRKEWARSLLNGVLRNYQRQRENLLHRADRDEAAAYSFPLWMISKWKNYWGSDMEPLVDGSNEAPPMTLRVNLRLLSRHEYLLKLEQAEIDAYACDSAASAIILKSPVGVEKLPGFRQGEVSVQDESAQLAAGLLDLQPGQRVLDVCAAPGGKTLHILESEPALAEVHALDIARERLTRIEQNLQRCGLSARLIVGDGANPSAWWDGKPYDRILVDAPCSATGVIRRHPDIKLLRKPTDIAQLQTQQQQILQAVWPLLAPGGVLLYATCSVMKAENEQQALEFLETHPGAKEWEISEVGWGRSQAVGRQILTGEGNMDGFYYARFIKQ